ncbi:hypothetical protein D3C84_1271760 [compost metagenome]
MFMTLPSRKLIKPFPSILDEISHRCLTLRKIVQLDGFDQTTAVSHDILVVASGFVTRDD